MSIKNESINEREARLKARAEAIEEMILAEVKKISDADNQLEALKFHFDNIIAGEETNKQVITVLLSGGRHSDPEMKQIITLKGSPGSGKTTLANRLSENFKTKKIGRFTTHALNYSVLTPFEVLYIMEIGNMDQGDQGISMVKFLSCDDKGYNVEFTIRTEGGFTTKTKHIPPMTVISTTVKLTLESQFDRRTWILNSDESKEQTKRVTQFIAKLEQQKNEVNLGTRLITDYDLSMKVIRRFFDSFSIVRVNIVYPKTLANFLGHNQLRIRGDIAKIFTFVKLYVQFNKKRLKQFHERFGMNSYIPPEVCVDALKLLKDPLTSMLSRIDKRSEALIEVLNELGFGKASGYVITKDARDKIAIKLGKNHNTIKSWLHNWCSAGVASHNSGKPLIFTLLYDVDVIKEKLDKISIKFESFDDLITEMRKEAHSFFASLSTKHASEGFSQ